MDLAKRLIVTFLCWLALFILSAKACTIVDKKYKVEYKLKHTLNLGFFRRFFIFSDRDEGKITWYVFILNIFYYVCNINFIPLFIYFIYKTAWGVDVWGYSTAALTFAILQVAVPIAAVAFDFFYDFKTDKVRYGIKPKQVTYEEDDEDEDPYANYESNT